MSKSLKPLWQIQEMLALTVATLAPGSGLIPAVEYEDSEVRWDEECQGLGRAVWTYGFIVPNGMPPNSVMAKLHASYAKLQARFDIGLTAA